MSWRNRAASCRAFSCAAIVSCAPRGGTQWVQDVSGMSPESREVRVTPLSAGGSAPAAPSPTGDPQGEGGEGDGDGAPVLIREHGRRRGQSRSWSAELFRNTYYDFPIEGGGARRETLFDASCAPIASVTVEFHDQVCVQGSGRIASGATVSFSRRDCPCATVCPRTSQRVCFEQLDPRRFPHGRGATGRPITPLRTVAVDSEVIPLGTTLFIPELVGLPRPDGTRHDGCFLAEDRGVKVVGNQVDVFTGDPSVTKRWNALFPSNTGVHVRAGDARCAALGAPRLP